MPERPALQTAVFAQLAARQLLARGKDPARVFAGTGFGPELLDQQEPSAPSVQTMAFFTHGARLSGDPLFGFRLGCNSDLRIAGLLGYIARSSATTGDVLRNIARYGTVLNDAWVPDGSQLAAKGKFSWACSAMSGRPVRQYTEFLFALFLTELRQLTGRHVVLKEVRFAHPRNQGIPEMEQYFGCVPRFSARHSQVVLAQADLDLPIASADPQLLGVLRAYGDQLLLGQQAGTLRDKVEEAISARLSDGSATLSNVAADLGFSSRTLSRRLAQAGTSFFAILEDRRHVLACHYLCQGTLPLSEIAFLLGYASLSSFIEAFRRWTGQTPGDFRANQQKGEAANWGKSL
jgi:AraC-like DNA-binding protein